MCLQPLRLLNRRESIHVGYLAGALLGLILIGCSGEDNTPAPAGPESFFPPLVFAAPAPEGVEPVEAREREEDWITRNWYYDWLTRLAEPSLYQECSHGIDVYRLSWLPSFDAPISIRLTNASGQINLVGKRLLEAPYHNPETTRRAAVSRGLTSDQWDSFAYRIEYIGFWQMSNVMDRYSMLDDSTLSVRVSGSDGARWIIEGCRSGDYHIVDRWSGHGDGYRSVFEAALGLARMEEFVPALY